MSSERGRRITEDESENFIGWHWISKPVSRRSREKRARFFATVGSSTKGKDSWVVENVSDSSAVMWPLMWCQLANKGWLEEEQDVLFQKYEEGDQASRDELDEFLAGETNETQYGILEQINLISSQFALVSNYACPENLDAALLNGLADKWDITAGAVLHAWAFSSDTILHTLRMDLDQAMIEFPDRKKEFEDVRASFNSLAKTISEIIQAADLETLTFKEAIESLRSFFDVESSLDPADRRTLFFLDMDELRVLRIQREQRTSDAQNELRRLVADYPRATGSPGLDEEQRALSYTAPLFSSALHLQSMMERRLQSLATCKVIAMRPPRLEQTRFEPWVSSSHQSRGDAIRELLSLVDVASSGDTIQGVNLMFDTACRTGLDGTPNALTEPRPECENVLLSKAVLSLFPTLSLRIVKDFVRLQGFLSALVLAPSQEAVQEMLEVVKTFMRELGQGNDEDFYTAFAYHRDGRMLGDLFRTTEESFTEILESLENHEKTYTEWIRTSVEFSDELKHMRRANVKELADKPEIAASVDGCACEEEWSAWVTKGALPYRRSFQGCAVLNDGSQIWGFGEDVSAWTGVCRGRERFSAVSHCDKIGKLVACDPSVAPSTTTFRIWSSSATRSEPISLPLVSNTFFFGLTVRPHTIPNFCGPDMARFAVFRTWQWSSSTWAPWTQARQACWEGYFAPPGIKIDLLQCATGQGEDFQDKSGTDQWTVTLTLPFLISSNVWGLGGRGSGDAFQTWFTGTWLKPMKMVLGNGVKGFLGANPAWDKPGVTAFGAFNLNAKEIALSGSAYWFALAAEVVSTFNLPLSTNAVVSGYDGKKDVNQNSPGGAIMASAWLVWSLLRKYEVIPSDWDLWVGRPAMAKWLNSITPSNVVFSPFRSGNAYVLTVRYNVINQISVRPWNDFFPHMSKQQLLILGERTSEMGAPTASFLEEFRSSVGNGVDNLRNLDRSVLEYVLNTWAEQYDANATEQMRIANRCPGAIARYNIDFSQYEGDSLSSLELYWFHSKSLSAWIPDSLDSAGGPWYLALHSDGWFAEALPAHEAARFFPPQYKEILQKVGRLGVDFEGSPELRRNVFASMDTDNLICLVEQILPRGGRGILDGYIEQGCNVDDQAERSLWGPFFACFSNAWKAEFFTTYWSRIIASVHQMGSLALNALLSEFKRGEYEGIEMDAAGNGEASEFRLAPSLASSLILGFKIGLSQVRIPGIAQVMPWLSWTVVYSVNKLIEAFRVRLLGASSTTQDSSISQQHQARIDACKACLETPEMAFCDNEFVIQSMFSSPADMDALREYNADRCVPLTVEQKNQCQTGKGSSRNREAGILFQDAMCPCFDKVSGQAVSPDWITSIGSCDDLRLADSGESLRVANKASDFTNGFAQIGELFDLGTVQVVPPSSKGCTKGYTCCGAVIEGAQHLRCVNQADLESTGWFRDADCKHFRPTDALARNAERKRRWYLIARRPAWSEAASWQCKGDRRSAGSVFDGYWSSTSGSWTLDAASA